MQNSVGHGGQLYRSQEKKVLERCSVLHPFEKELLEQRSSVFHHKNTPGFNDGSKLQNVVLNNPDGWHLKYCVWNKSYTVFDDQSIIISRW
jgi:hypothetical protein